MSLGADAGRKRLKLSEASERLIAFAIAFALVSLIPAIVLGVLLYREVESRSDANAELIRKIQRNEVAQEKIRKEARAAIRKADIANCEEDEVVKGRLRDIVRFKPDEIVLTLEQIGIDPQSERGQQLIARSKASADAAVHALRRRDCEKLPDPTAPFGTG